jgi:hypothetical protein
MIMAIMFNGNRIFCNNCCNFELSFVEDELMSQCAGSKSLDIIKCARCNSYYSKEFIEEHIDDFTSEVRFEELMKKKMERIAYYNNFRPQEPVVEHKPAKKNTDLEQTNLNGWMVT